MRTTKATSLPSSVVALKFHAYGSLDLTSACRSFAHKRWLRGRAQLQLGHKSRAADAFLPAGGRSGGAAVTTELPSSSQVATSEESNSGRSALRAALRPSAERYGLTPELYGTTEVVPFRAAHLCGRWGQNTINFRLRTPRSRPTSTQITAPRRSRWYRQSWCCSLSALPRPPRYRCLTADCCRVTAESALRGCNLQVQR